MVNDLESKIAALEAEISTKDQIISRLNQQAVFAYLLPAYIHEERHMLSALSMSLTRMFEDSQTKDIERYKERIIHSFESLRELNEHLAHFMRSSENVVSLNYCIQETKKLLLLLYIADNVLLQTRLSEEGESFRVPNLSIRQVLMNILLNALESLRETAKNDRRVIIESLFNKTFAKIQISDNGHGINTELVDKIWQPGFSTKPHKVGIGLTISRDIVKSMGGHISVDSVEGVLTRFTVSIPLKQEMTI